VDHGGAAGSLTGWRHNPNPSTSSCMSLARMRRQDDAYDICYRKTYFITDMKIGLIGYLECNIVILGVAVILTHKSIEKYSCLMCPFDNQRKRH
jgi:hypothetical protein